MSVWGLARRCPRFSPYARRGWFATAAAASILPDLDSLVGMPHRGVTHTLGFAVLASGLLVATVAFRHRRHALWLWPVFALIVALHGVMDLLSGGGPPVALFWPMSQAALFPIEGGLPLHGYTRDWTELGGLLLSPWTLAGMFREALIFGPFFLGSLVRSRAAGLALAGFGVLTWGTWGVAEWKARRPVITGRVVDRAGRPVSGVSLSVPETRIGWFHVEDRKIVRAGEIERWDWLLSPCTTDAEGRFSGRILWPGRSLAILATGPDRTHGGVILLNDSNLRSTLTLTVSPLATVRGRLELPPGAGPGVEVYVFLSASLWQPLRVCKTQSRQFEFTVPPGDYRVDAYAIMGVSEGKSLSVGPNQAVVDLGVLKLK